MKLTAKNLRATYDLLRIFKPFNRWNMPPGSQIRFRVTESVEFWARVSEKPIEMEFSGPRPWTLATLTRSMAHEMIHVEQAMRGVLSHSEDANHGREFHRRASAVCREFGFDPEAF